MRAILFKCGFSVENSASWSVLQSFAFDRIRYPCEGLREHLKQYSFSGTEVVPGGCAVWRALEPVVSAPCFL